ncbi:MAG TPA: hypothetical protein VIO15_01220 [Bacteroidales bacterium]
MNRKGYTTYDLNNGFSTHSISQSFDAACAYNDYHGSWGNTVAGSRRAAQYNFDNGLGAVNFTALQSIQATSTGGPFGAAGPCGGSSSGSGYIDATNTSRFPGVQIHIDRGLDQGYMNPFTKTIHVPGVYANMPKDLHDYVMHEYGHYLQLDALQTVYGDVGGMIRFVTGIMIPSMMTSQSANHMSQWYEINANDLSRAFTRDKFYDTKTYQTTP